MAGSVRHHGASSDTLCQAQAAQASAVHGHESGYRNPRPSRRRKEGGSPRRSRRRQRWPRRRGRGAGQGQPFCLVGAMVAQCGGVGCERGGGVAEVGWKAATRKRSDGGKGAMRGQQEGGQTRGSREGPHFVSRVWGTAREGEGRRRKRRRRSEATSERERFGESARPTTNQPPGNGETSLLDGNSPISLQLRLQLNLQAQSTRRVCNARKRDPGD